jgi:hypothetical protein
MNNKKKQLYKYVTEYLDRNDLISENTILASDWLEQCSKDFVLECFKIVNKSTGMSLKEKIYFKIYKHTFLRQEHSWCINGWKK